MIYVVIEELAPEMSGGRFKLGTLAFSVGFVLMMTLDVALG
jgi:ZIP family zinc transporter